MTLHHLMICEIGAATGEAFQPPPPPPLSSSSPVGFAEKPVRLYWIFPPKYALSSAYIDICHFERHI